MTFNIRLDTPGDDAAGNGWRHRRESVLETIRRSDADLVGVQEAWPAQLEALRDGLPAYRSVGRGREAKGLGEHVPILYARERLELLEHRDFWLSPDPEEEGSLGWDAENPRICTAALFRDRRSGRAFAVFNTHLDQRGEMARLEGAYLVLKRMADTAGGVPTIVTGDFNDHPTSAPLEVFRAAGFRDVLEAAPRAAVGVGGDCGPADGGTFHGFTGRPRLHRIDYVLCDAGWTVLSACIDRAPAAGRLPSDHFPIAAEIVLDPEGELDEDDAVPA